MARAQAQASDFFPAFRNSRFSQDNFSVRHHRFQRNILERGRKYSSADRQHFPAYTDRLGKIARHVAERREKQISETVSAQAAPRMKSVLKQAAKQSFILRERDHAVANVARREYAVLAAQPARASAIIGD